MAKYVVYINVENMPAAKADEYIAKTSEKMMNSEKKFFSSADNVLFMTVHSGVTRIEYLRSE